MRCSWSLLVKVLMVVTVLCWQLPVHAEPEANTEEPPAKASALHVGTVTGSVIDAEGKKAVAGVPVEVYDEKGEKLIFSTVTDKDGKYTLEELVPGNYRLIVAGKIMTEVTVMTDGEIVTLDFKVPHVYFTENPEEKAEEHEGGTKSTKRAVVRFALVTVGVGAAVALPLTLVHGGSSSHAEASPDS